MYGYTEDNFFIGNRMRKIRNKFRYTREDFAEILNVSASTIQSVERGYSTVSTYVLKNIFFNFGISSDYILYGIERNSSLLNRIVVMLKYMKKEEIKYFYKNLVEYKKMIKKRK